MLDVPTAYALLRRTRPRRNAEGYPLDVRASVVVLIRARLATGLSIHAVARELGLNRSTVKLWLSRNAEVEAFVPVLVLEPTDDRAQDIASRPCPMLTLISPGGYRLNGLGLDDAILALQQLS